MAPRRHNSQSHPQSTSLNCRFGSPVRGAFSRLSPPSNAAAAPGVTDKARVQEPVLVPSGGSTSMSLSVNGPLMDLERAREGPGGEDGTWCTGLDEQGPPMSPEAALFGSLDHTGWRDIPLDDDEPLDGSGMPAGLPGSSPVEVGGKAAQTAEQEASLLFLMQLQRRDNASPSPSPSPSPPVSLAHSRAHLGLQPLTHSASEPPLRMQQRANGEGAEDCGSPCSGSLLTLSRSADHGRGANALALTNAMWLSGRPPAGMRPSDPNTCATDLASSSAPSGGGGVWGFPVEGGCANAESRRWYEEEEEGCAMVLQSPTSASAMELDAATATEGLRTASAALAAPLPAALASEALTTKRDTSVATEEGPQAQGAEAWHPALPAPPPLTSGPPAVQGVPGFGHSFWANSAGAILPTPALQPAQGDEGKGKREEGKGEESQGGQGREDAMEEGESASGAPRGRPRTARPRPRQSLLSGVWGVASGMRMGMGSKESPAGRRKGDSLLPTIDEGSAVLAPQRLVPSQPLEAQLSPSLAALLSVLSTDYDTEPPKPPAHVSQGGTSSSSTDPLSTSPSAGSSSGSGSSSGGAAGSKSVPQSPKSAAALASRQLEVTPSLSALLSILSVDSESEGPCSPKTRALLPIKSMGTLATNLERELDLEMEPAAAGGLARQCSLDSGIRWLERKGSPSEGPSPTGSLHSSPAQSPVRTPNSSLNSTPSPVLQRRLTGNRVSVYEECWQAGPERKFAEAEASGLRSVCEVLETEGTAAFYRGFKMDAPPVRQNVKRTKV